MLDPRFDGTVILAVLQDGWTVRLEVARIKGEDLLRRELFPYTRYAVTLSKGSVTCEGGPSMTPGNAIMDALARAAEASGGESGNETEAPRHEAPRPEPLRSFLEGWELIQWNSGQAPPISSIQVDGPGQIWLNGVELALDDQSRHVLKEANSTVLEHGDRFEWTVGRLLTLNCGDGRQLKTLGRRPFTS